LQLAERDRWIGWDVEQRRAYLELVPFDRFFESSMCEKGIGRAMFMRSISILSWSLKNPRKWPVFDSPRPLFPAQHLYSKRRTSGRLLFLFLLGHSSAS